MRFFFHFVLGCLVSLMSGALYAKNNNVSQEMATKHVYMIHGYNASPESNWFPWLKQKLKEDGVQVTVLAMPNPAHPDHAQWVTYLQQQVKSPNKDTFFVAHSLGCITLLRYLNTLKPNTKIGGFVLVSGFDAPLSLLPELDTFTKGKVDFGRIMKLTENRIMVTSDNDSIVPYKQTENLSRELRAKLFTVPKGGHFLASDGFTQLPIVYEEVDKMLH
jgi:uncharacterized protein